ncbi:MAG: MFS transporter, partial [Gammaproteobacteria bacterium]|nr:MFS transporter [Gammaproteobacteria bacterium]
VPVILLSLAVIAAWRYPLSPSVHARLKTLLAQRRSDAPITEAMEEETRELEELLIG